MDVGNFFKENFFLDIPYNNRRIDFKTFKMKSVLDIKEYTRHKAINFIN